ncbi:SDR family NAD(P)-dependent oxidoreductase [Jatrophihabitans sp. DSM 45814]
MDALLDLSGLVAVVTGAGTGIGARTAHLLAEHGADVSLAGRKADRLEETATSVREATGRAALVVPTDVREDDSVANLISTTADHYGQLDILINNAGGAYMFPLKDTPPDRWRNAVELNMTSAYLCAQAALPHLVKSRSPAIVNISSAAGVNGVKGGAAYSAAKAGLQMLTRVIAAEWGPKGVRCNAIAVGGVASEGALRSWARFGESAETMGQRVPLRRVGYPDDIANGVLFFVSPLSSWVSGQTISIDGGPSGMGGLTDDVLWPSDQ